MPLVEGWQCSFRVVGHYFPPLAREVGDGLRVAVKKRMVFPACERKRAVQFTPLLWLVGPLHLAPSPVETGAPVELCELEDFVGGHPARSPALRADVVECGAAFLQAHLHQHRELSGYAEFVVVFFEGFVENRFVEGELTASAAQHP